MKNNLSILDLVKNKDKVMELLMVAEKLQELCSELGINPFQPGAIKELKMAMILGHNWIRNKKEADACSRDGNNVYEYLSSTEKGAGQIDRFFKDGEGEQHEKHMKSVKRITRNEKFFLSFTNADTTKPLDILRIYVVSPEDILNYAKIQLENSTNSIAHIGFDENFAKKYGTLLYESKKG